MKLTFKNKKAVCPMQIFWSNNMYIVLPRYLKKRTHEHILRPQDLVLNWAYKSVHNRGSLLHIFFMSFTNKQYLTKHVIFYSIFKRNQEMMFCIKKIWWCEVYFILTIMHLIWTILIILNCNCILITKIQWLFK